MTRDECYKVLQIPITANMSEVRNAYLKLSKKYHPDINSEGKLQFQKINEAYNRIKNNDFSVVYNSGFSGSKFNFQDNLYDLFKQIIVVFRNEKGPERNAKLLRLIGSLVVSLVMAFVFFRPIISFVFGLLFDIISFVFGLLFDICYFLLHMLTIISMNAIDAIVNIAVLIFNITVKPILFMGNLIFSLIANVLIELRALAVICTILVVLIKIYENVQNGKTMDHINVFIASIVFLIIVIISSFF